MKKQGFSKEDINFFKQGEDNRVVITPSLQKKTTTQVRKIDDHQDKTGQGTFVPDPINPDNQINSDYVVLAVTFICVAVFFLFFKKKKPSVSLRNIGSSKPKEQNGGQTTPTVNAVTPQEAEYIVLSNGRIPKGKASKLTSFTDQRTNDNFSSYLDD